MVEAVGAMKRSAKEAAKIDGPRGNRVLAPLRVLGIQIAASRY